ncbi:hypothetical protein R6Q59_035983, partial [Mikania micrantha]
MEHKSWLSLLLIMTMMIMFLVLRSQAVCIEEERKALLEIKASLISSHGYGPDVLVLPTWVDNGECCDWDRVKCNKTTGHVTNLLLKNLKGNLEDDMSFESKDPSEKLWPLNISIFLHFEELGSLDLSWNYLDNEVLNTEFAALENLESLDLSGCNFNGTFQPKGFKNGFILKNLETLILDQNSFNESVISSLKFLPSLTNLDLSRNKLYGSFPPQDLAYLTNLEKLDLSGNSWLTTISSIQGTMTSLLHLNLDNNFFDNDTMMFLGAFPSLQSLSLDSSRFGGAAFDEAMASFPHLEILDLSNNNLIGNFPSALSSLQVLYLAQNNLDGSLTPKGLCQMKNLRELDLSNNMFVGNLPQCINQLALLKVLEISSNQFTGTIQPSLTANLTSLEYINFSHNKFEGLLAFSSFANHTKLEVMEFINDNDNFEVDTEEPTHWIPMFQLKVLSLSSCNMNKHNGNVVPGFLLHQHNLRLLDLSHNSLKGNLPNWLLENNTMLEVLYLRNNSFGGSILMPRFRNPYFSELDASRNDIKGVLPHGVSNSSGIDSLSARNNLFEGHFPCGTTLASFNFLDISNNFISGPIPSCLNMEFMEHIHLEYNRFTGSIPNIFRNMTRVLTLDISNNYLSGKIPKFLGELSSLRILLLRKNNFSGSIPKELCQLTSVSLIDLSNNLLSGSIPSCIQNITGPTYLAYIQTSITTYYWGSTYKYSGVLRSWYSIMDDNPMFDTRSQVQFTTKSISYIYKGSLPEMKEQFATFSMASYEGNQFLCGPPLVKKCTTTSSVNVPSAKDDTDQGYAIDL